MVLDQTVIAAQVSRDLIARAHASAPVNGCEAPTTHTRKTCAKLYETRTAPLDGAAAVGKENVIVPMH
ncbi:hypothetical protein SAMN04244572_04441 [Azotobacter beijerinckii]|uniref:Uncharacterized protein n=1 Tax=Azotobacter beijerinckii TaxID=170623 RepID=A0A1H6ZP62_9GAMM|nr:hypothetical protein SAMN04244572_04441 [Azotobacter beijerinckii]SER92500.1 hypothetical protein SAMN04244573_04590 [Azotobacter beijerinckii]